MMGPPGVGKTALAEGLARDTGFNFVKLLNPRTKWVGESERNFFKALQTLRSLTPVVVVEDEADQSEHGRDEYSGDTGVGNRLRQMRFDFMGDPAIQGKVLWIRITNRPDRLDKADLRSGRSSERIPFFMPDTAEKSHIFKVVASRSQIACDFPDFDAITRYLEARHPELITGGDIEELVYRAYRTARLAGREEVSQEDFQQVIDDFLPPHQMEVLRHMERLALNQCSSRRFIPARVWAWAARGKRNGGTLNVIFRVKIKNLLPIKVSTAEEKWKLCPICLLSDDKVMRQTGEGAIEGINCPRCKSFTISYTGLSEPIDCKLRPKLSAWIRDRNEQQNEVPLIDSDTIKDRQAGLPNYSPREKQVIFLKNIERKTEYPGKAVKIDAKYDIPLAWAASEEEFLYYVNTLIERGLLRNLLGEVTVTKGFRTAFPVGITADGWDYLEQHERDFEERTQAFVAMSFSDDLKPIYEGPISRAIKEAGYKPYRVDAEPHSDRIDVKIIAEIKNSRFVVADVTEQKRGVYFEAGYALGLGLPVLWCVNKNDLDKVHFDTRQYNHIVWETEADLETGLYDFICAIIGKGKEAK